MYGIKFQDSWLTCYQEDEEELCSAYLFESDDDIFLFHSKKSCLRSLRKILEMEARKEKRFPGYASKMSRQNLKVVEVA